MMGCCLRIPILTQGRDLLRSGRLLAVLLILPAMLGCAADSDPRLAEEVDRLVSPGSGMAAAMQALEGAGFQCGDRLDFLAEPGEIVCSRERSHRVMATCIHRVVLTPGDGGATLAQIRLPSIVCAGL